MNESVFFLGHYFPSNISEDRNTSPAACSKIEYLLKCLQEIGYNVSVISACNTLGKESYKTRRRILNPRLSIITFNSIRFSSKIGRFLSHCFYYIQIVFFLLLHVKRKSILFIYHSTVFIRFIRLLVHIKKYKVVYDVEEIYNAVISNQRRIRKEIKSIKKASAYVFPSEKLNCLVNINNRPAAIIYGPYLVNTPATNYNPDGYWHCVYAGTFNSIKGGAINAIESSKYLPSNYFLHILGFGEDKEIESVKTRIIDVSKNVECKISYDGKKTGLEFIKFLSRCQIGLSTQNSYGLYNDTSFPSKVLTYMSNGLTVVSSNIPVLRESALADYIVFCDEDTPEGLARAIISASKKRIDGRSLIKKLDEQAKEELRVMLEKL